MYGWSGIFFFFLYFLEDHNMDQLTGFIARHRECTAAVRWIINHTFAAMLYQYPCSIACCLQGIQPPLENRRRRNFLNRAKNIYLIHLPQLGFLPQLESTWRMAYFLAFLIMEFPKWGVAELDGEDDVSSLSPLQPLILKSHGHIHCGQIPIPVFMRKTFSPPFNPFSYSLKPLLVYIACITQCAAPVIQVLVLFDRSGSLYPQRRENSRS